MSSTRNAIWTFGTLTAITALAAVGVACGGGSSAANTQTPAKLAATATKPPDLTAGPAPTESEAQQTVAVSLSEWKITGPAGAGIGPLKTGDVTFNVHNDGQIQHEFVLVKSDADPSSFPVKDDFKFDEEAAGASPGETGNIDPGQAKTVTIRLDAGRYVFFCNIPSHYQQGMYGRLVVQ